MQHITRRRYTDDFKAQAILLAESLGPAKAARQLDMSVKTLGNWLDASRAGRPLSAPSRKPVGELESELARLRAENATLKIERDILKSDGVLRQGVQVRYAVVRKPGSVWTFPTTHSGPVRQTGSRHSISMTGTSPLYSFMPCHARPDLMCPECRSTLSSAATIASPASLPRLTTSAIAAICVRLPCVKAARCMLMC